MQIASRVVYRILVRTDGWAQQNAGLLGALTGGGLTAYVFLRLLG